MTDAVISATSVLCAAGFGATQVWASARARQSCVRNSAVTDRDHERIPMGLVPEDALEPEDAALDSFFAPSRARRMLRLAAPPFRELIAPIAGTPVALYLGLPELTPASSPWIDQFAQQLCTLAGATLDEASSQTFPCGRASALVALEGALTALAADPSRTIVVGGVDTYLDLKLLGALGAEGRVLGPRVMDGFIPGEGAGFVLLKGQKDDGLSSRNAQIHGAASGSDPGHRYGTEPARGEGLAEILQQLRGRLTSSVGPIGSVFTGLNGENLDAKLWGVAQIRHGDLFSSATVVEHPATVYGDAGAATGAILLAIAATAVSSGQRQGPALIWAASDHGKRGCSILSAPAASEG